MLPPRLQVVDDNYHQRRRLRHLLSKQGFLVATAPSAASAFVLIRSFHPQIVLIDIALPGISGIKLFESLRSSSETSHLPVILMTGLSVPGDLLTAAARGLNAGSILVKGKNIFQLLSRIRESLSILPPGLPPSGHAVVDGANERVVFDTVSQRIWIKEREIGGLPPRRFQLLCALLLSGRPITREELFCKIWPDRENINVVDVTLLRLRRDLQHLPDVRIRTCSSGYQLIIEARP